MKSKISLPLFGLLLLFATVLASPVQQVCIKPEVATLNNDIPPITDQSVDSDKHKEIDTIPNTDALQDPVIDNVGNLKAGTSSSDDSNIYVSDDGHVKGDVASNNSLETSRTLACSLGDLGVLPYDIFQELLSKLNIFDKMKLSFTQKDLILPWGPGELEFAKLAKGEVSYLNQYRNYNEHKLLEDVIPRKFAKYGRSSEYNIRSESNIRDVMQEIHERIRLTQDYAGRGEMLFDSLKKGFTTYHEQREFENFLKDVYPNRKQLPWTSEVVSPKTVYPIDDDWLMDLQLAFTLRKGDHCDMAAFLTEVRRIISPRTPIGHRFRTVEMTQHIHKAFEFLKELHQLRQTIDRENSGRFPPYDNDPRMTELLAEKLNMDPIKVKEHMTRARAKVTYDLAVSLKMPFTVCKYTFLQGNFEKAVELAVKTRAEIGSILLRYPTFSSEFLENLLKIAVQAAETEWKMGLGRGIPMDFDPEVGIISLILKHPCSPPGPALNEIVRSVIDRVLVFSQQNGREG